MLAELVAALLIALVFTLLFVYGIGRAGPWGGFLWFFLVLFLGAWAIAAWVEPVGPLLWGVAWVPIIFGALLIALLIAAIPPTEPRARPAAATTETPEPEVALIGLFFWLLLAGLFLVILLAFLL